jgi:hypothetical protein
LHFYESTESLSTLMLKKRLIRYILLMNTINTEKNRVLHKDMCKGTCCMWRRYYLYWALPNYHALETWMNSGYFQLYHIFTSNKIIDLVFQHIIVSVLIHWVYFIHQLSHAWVIHQQTCVMPFHKSSWLQAIYNSNALQINIACTLIQCSHTYIVRRCKRIETTFIHQVFKRILWYCIKIKLLLLKIGCCSLDYH